MAYPTNELTRRIAERIRESPDGAIPFRDFMAMALYDPEYGYYMSDRPKVGKDGDFYTSAHIGGVMGELIAREALRLAGEDSRLRIAEWGGGDGRMAQAVLDAIGRTAPERLELAEYVLVEASSYHRRLQAEALQSYTRQVRVLTPQQWSEQAPHAFHLIYANELLDAFPVHRIMRRAGEWAEAHVAEAEPGGFEERWLAPTARVQPMLARIGAYIAADGYAAELSPDACDWVAMMAGAVSAGTQLLLIDYGDEREELLAPHRPHGTLAAYRRHERRDDWLHAPGEQDLTAHVDFTAIREAATAAGFEAGPLITQKQFLLEAGILELLRDTTVRDPFHPDARRNRAVRQLLLSDGMSELFKVQRLRR